MAIVPELVIGTPDTVNSAGTDADTLTTDPFTSLVHLPLRELYCRDCPAPSEPNPTSDNPAKVPDVPAIDLITLVMPIGLLVVIAFVWYPKKAGIEFEGANP
jgi:hypothetical protein